MACLTLLRTSGLFLLLFLITNAYAVFQPWIFAVSVNKSRCADEKCVLNLNLEVSNVESWSLTREPAVRGALCNPTITKDVLDTELIVQKNDRMFFCAKVGEQWLHQGVDLYLDGDVIGISKQLENLELLDDVADVENNVSDVDGLRNDVDVNRNRDAVSDVVVETWAYLPNKLVVSEPSTELNSEWGEFQNTEEYLSRPKRDANSSDTSLGPKNATTVINDIKLIGFRIEESEKEPKIVDEMIPSVLRNTNFNLRLFGEKFVKGMEIAFTHTKSAYGDECVHLLDETYKVEVNSEEDAFISLVAPYPADTPEGHKFYFCIRDSPSGRFKHQGNDTWKILGTHHKLLPLWASIILIIILLLLASLFSGLNLGLMALDRTELKIIANTGTEKERKYARAIMPVRAHGNYLLCTILLSNVAVNSTFTVILDDLTSGLVAVIGSTLAIVFIAEITPQAVCARHGLFVGAKSIWIMKIVMGICAPLAWPTSKLLDYFLGEEIGTHYNRERLKELVKVTNHVNDLDKEEVNIISGALDLRKKKVQDVMTKLDDCFMLPITSVLDFETMSEIVKSGYSRIPVYEGYRGNIVTVLFIKDLAFVDPDDNTPLRTLAQYYQNPCNFVFEDVTLDVMLKQFKEGHKGHMAFVQRIDRSGDGDPVYQTVGLVTLEDVIEEMIQAEIVDESDVITDNRTKKRLARPLNRFQDLAAFAGHQPHRVHVSPQLVLATFQFLSTSVDPFRPEMISETVLRRLLKQDVVKHIKLRGDEDRNDPKAYVFQEGRPVDYFVLILEGRVEVTVGRENLVFEAGPFTYFGIQALTQNIGVAEPQSPSALGSLQNLNMDSMLRHTFVPDYSVRAIADVYYLTIKRSMYLAAKRATLMEKGALTKGNTNEQIEPEVDKLLRDEGRNESLRETDAPPQPQETSAASPTINSTKRKTQRRRHY
ncbi:unextended protein-like isoform X2 [Leguminivora glycinivorella]|uniref:unextended protein-like isoform X2 n=1 Tax=Leguminivora glycinivorella TaxID=1035111 RepID=UPI00200D2D11|nr:unextended protein-like isoform X2 [Leguminivora glycinivorella]